MFILIPQKMDQEGKLLYEINYYISDIPKALLNALRRTILGDLYSLSIDTVSYDVYSQDHPIFIQTTTTRLGLIPIKTSEYVLNKLLSVEECMIEDEPCKGCSKCGIPFSINGTWANFEKLYPEKSKEEFKKFYCNFDVYSQDIQIDKQWQNLVRIDESCMNIPIMKFTKFQSMICKGYIRKGNGNIHAKWNSASAVTIIEIDDHQPKNQNQKPNSFLFSIDPIGNLDGKDIFPMAMKYLKSKIQGYIDQFKSLNLKMKPVGPNYYEIEFNEDSTFGQLLFAYTILNPAIISCGYNLPYPSENFIYFHLHLPNDNQDNNNNPNDILVYHLEQIILDLALLKSKIQ